ncbi:MAG TPA: hypothetical protein VF283_13455 [Bryobacteraceae bacterium]
MADEQRTDKPINKREVSDHGGELRDVDIAAPGGSGGGSGGIGFPTHPQGENAADPVEQTLSNGTIGVDVSGVRAGAGNTRMTITPSLSDPKKLKAEEEANKRARAREAEEKSRAKGSGS